MNNAQLAVAVILWFAPWVLIWLLFPYNTLEVLLSAMPVLLGYIYFIDWYLEG